ncbi:hypothetical protein EDD85DRAFT_757387, partial [Armillaria nabsnona]
SQTCEVLQSFLNHLPKLHDYLMDHKADPELNMPCDCGMGTQTTCCRDCIAHRLCCDIHSLGYQLQIGHHGCPCSVPHSTVKVIIADVNGIHDTKLHFCQCNSPSPDWVKQLMEAQFFPVTLACPAMVFSFQLLRQIQLLHGECATNIHDMAGVLARLTNNKYYLRVAVHVTPQEEFSGKRLAHLVCRHTNKTEFARDRNFHINKHMSNTDPDDITLVKEHGFHPLCSDWEVYLKELKPAGNKKKVPCNNHKAVVSQNAHFKNCEYMGVAQVTCSHVFVYSTADFEKGEE